MMVVRKHLGRHDNIGDEVTRLIQVGVWSESPHVVSYIFTVRVIPRSKFDFPTAISPRGGHGPAHWRKSLQRRVGKTNRRHRAAQMRRAARGNWQRRNFSNCFQQSQIIRCVHLNNFCINRSGARDQTSFRRRFDHVVIGNQIRRNFPVLITLLLTIKKSHLNLTTDTTE
jgi:hypothetical protein